MYKECVATPSPNKQPRASPLGPSLHPSPALWRPYVRVNPSACSIHFWRVYSVDAAFCAGESLKRDTKRDMGSRSTETKRPCQTGTDRGGGGRPLSENFRYNSSPHLKIFAPNGGPYFSVRTRYRLCAVAPLRTSLHSPA